MTPPDLLSEFFAIEAVNWLGQFILWFVALAPLVAFLEYATHRWIMHWANRLLDPQLVYLKNHGTHHRGHNEGEFVEMPLRNCLLITSPVWLLLIIRGALLGSVLAFAIPAAAMFTWCVGYSYLWTRVHRAIHEPVQNRHHTAGRLFSILRDHHLMHHAHPQRNFGTLFPWTDYLFFTAYRRKTITTTQNARQCVE